jgi:hypothetical protein
MCIETTLLLAPVKNKVRKVHPAIIVLLTFLQYNVLSTESLQNLDHCFCQWEQKLDFQRLKHWQHQE